MTQFFIPTTRPPPRSARISRPPHANATCFTCSSAAQS
uniref:Uncharacterized protein n=1 Tax=viral metagenome TaxID=1070528 RepID=A0A6C0AT59_9ZZZZ